MAIVANFTTVRPNMSETRTAKDFYAFLGARPQRLGIVSKMYEQHTASYFTEGLGNVMYNKQKGSKFQPINSLLYEWEVEMQEVKRIPFADSVSSAYASNGMEVPMAFTERYYEVNDTFIIDETKQMCIVIDGPIRKSDRYFVYTCRLVEAENNVDLDVDGCMAGMTTRWVGCIQPELHEIGTNNGTVGRSPLIVIILV